MEAGEQTGHEAPEVQVDARHKGRGKREHVRCKARRTQEHVVHKAREAQEQCGARCT